MRVDGWTTPVAADGTWLCEHVDADGSGTLAERLDLARATRGPLGFPTATDRRFITCGRCGTQWRVWPQLSVAKPSLQSVAAGGPAYRIQPSPVRDVSRVFTLVRGELPDVQIDQLEQTFPDDDDGLWFLRRPHGVAQIQIESATGACPFLVEHGHSAWTAATVDEAASLVVTYLR